MKINLADKRYSNKYSVALQHPLSLSHCSVIGVLYAEAFVSFSLVIVNHWLIRLQAQL